MAEGEGVEPSSSPTAWLSGPVAHHWAPPSRRSVPLTGVEPACYGVVDRCSSVELQGNVPPARLERAVSSLSAKCLYRFGLGGMAEEAGFEPAPDNARSALAGQRLRPLGHSSLGCCRTRSAIRTRTVPVLGRLPPTAWATRASWTTSVSNRAGAVCKTALHTCASPVEQAAGVEPAPLRLHCACTTRRAPLAPVPSAGLEPALDGPSDRCLLPLGYEGICWIPGEDSNLDCRVQSAGACPLADPGGGRRAEGLAGQLSARPGRPTSVPAGWPAAASAPRPASCRPCAGYTGRTRPRCCARCSSRPGTAAGRGR